jgi:sulfite reductase beta subunit-like hemoprotein
MRFDYNLLRARVYRMVDAVSDVYDTVQVEVTTRTQSGIV